MVTKDKRGLVVVNPKPDERPDASAGCQAAEDWAVIERLQARNADVDPDAVLVEVTAAVEEVRQEMYAERQARRGH